jgi:chromosomal replication initiator protein
MITSSLQSQQNIYRAKIYQSKLTPYPIKKSIPIEHIKKIIVSYFNKNMEIFEDKSQTREIVFPRQIAMYLTRDLTGKSYQIIARNFGKSTVLVYNSFKIISGLIQLDYDVDFQVKEIKQLILKSVNI